MWSGIYAAVSLLRFYISENTLANNMLDNNTGYCLIEINLCIFNDNGDIPIILQAAGLAEHQFE